MKLAATLCLVVALLGCASGAKGDATFVPSDLPVYVNGVRVPPRDGGHHISLDRENGLRVDGALYMAVATYPPFVAPVQGDGIPYAVHGALLAATAAIRAGGTRDQVKQAMVAFWRAEYGDSLAIEERGDTEYGITYRGQSVWLSVPDTDNYHPEERARDNYRALGTVLNEVVWNLKSGMLLLCGQMGVHSINASDADAAMAELDSLHTRATILQTVRGEPVYAPMEIVGGKYSLSGTEVRDFVAAQTGR